MMPGRTITGSRPLGCALLHPYDSHMRPIRNPYEAKP